MPLQSLLTALLFGAAPLVILALVASGSRTRGVRAGAWGGCIAALAVLGLMSYGYLAGGWRDAQGALLLVFGVGYAWIAALAVASVIWLGAWVWRAMGRRRPGARA